MTAGCRTGRVPADRFAVRIGLAAARTDHVDRLDRADHQRLGPSDPCQLLGPCQRLALLAAGPFSDSGVLPDAGAFPATEPAPSCRASTGPATPPTLRTARTKAKTSATHGTPAHGTKTAIRAALINILPRHGTAARCATRSTGGSGLTFCFLSPQCFNTGFQGLDLGLDRHTGVLGRWASPGTRPRRRAVRTLRHRRQRQS